MGPISGLAKITPKNDFASSLSVSFRDTAEFSIKFFPKKKVGSKKLPTIVFLFICLRLRVQRLMTR